MGRNLVICCDGTNNQLSSDRTNVVRTASVASGQLDQLVYYDPGVGTLPDLWSRSKVAQANDLLMGLMVGQGFEEKVMDAYRFLMRNYRPGDRVFLFGFSRGAYTVRALAGMLHSVGLLHPGLDNMVRYALTYWKEDHPDEDGKPTRSMHACAELRRTYGQPCQVHFVGVWDTVSSIGMINNFQVHPHTRYNPSIDHLRQALSLDERRKAFRQNLASSIKEKPQDIKNVWFPGVHSDVGGGYAENEAGLAMLAFNWMMREAEIAGLRIDPLKRKEEACRAAKADACGAIHESLEGLGWNLVEWIPVRKWNWTKEEKEWRLARKQPRDAMRDAAKPDVYLHASVLERMRADNYRPANLPATEAEIRKAFKIEM